MNLSDLKSVIGIGVTRIAFAIATALVIQLGAIYVVWDALNSRMDDLSGHQVAMSGQLGAIREDAGFLRAKFSQVEAETLRQDGLMETLEDAVRQLSLEQATHKERVERIAALSASIEAQLRQHKSALEDIDDFQDQAVLLMQLRLMDEASDEVIRIFVELESVQASLNGLLEELNEVDFPAQE